MTTEHSEYASFARDIYGKVTFPGDRRYGDRPKPWLQVIEQHPAFIVEAASVDDVVACVNLARESKLVLGVMSTGHGIAAPCDSGLILRLSNLTHIEIDAARRTARIEPGVVSRELLEAAHKHHLAYPARQVSNVGVVGYMVGGGKGWLVRKIGERQIPLLALRSSSLTVSSCAQEPKKIRSCSGGSAAAATLGSSYRSTWRLPRSITSSAASQGTNIAAEMPAIARQFQGDPPGVFHHDLRVLAVSTTVWLSERGGRRHVSVDRGRSGLLNTSNFGVH
jgi:hypothetical protein